MLAKRRDLSWVIEMGTKSVFETACLLTVHMMVHVSDALMGCVSSRSILVHPSAGGSDTLTGSVSQAIATAAKLVLEKARLLSAHMSGCTSARQ